MIFYWCILVGLVIAYGTGTDLISGLMFGLSGAGLYDVTKITVFGK